MMGKLCKKTFHLDVKRRILWRISILRRYLRYLWKQIYACWIDHRSSSSSSLYSSNKKNTKYRQLLGPACSSNSPLNPPHVMVADHCDDLRSTTVRMCCAADSAPSDLVSLKIGLFGDSQTGKSSFLAKYAGESKLGREFVNDGGMNHVDKTLCVEGARISYSIWEVGGDESCSLDHIASVCKDSVAVLFMFDLTSRMTLNSVIKWYQEARKWNQTAIPVLVGTKFDEFVQLPIDLQWTIASQARAYAKALNATLFFSSATYNINVNKIFKFITAKLFDLQWNMERNLNVGEPIIDY